MKKNIIAVLVLFVLFSQCTGIRPKNLGIKDNKFSECPATPNCVNSLSAEKDDKEHYIVPLKYSSSKTAAYEKLLSVLATLPRVKIIEQKQDYIYAEFTSLVFRFVDDVEFYFGIENVIHFRSASRLGYSDMGVNRKRIEEIKDLFNKN